MYKYFQYLIVYLLSLHIYGRNDGFRNFSLGNRCSGFKNFMKLIHYIRFLSTVLKSSRTVNRFFELALYLKFYVFAFEFKNHIFTTPQHGKCYQNKLGEKYTEL